MTHLNQIARRHGLDAWKDIAFIATAILLLALAIATTTSKGIGTQIQRSWSVTVVDGTTMH